MRPKWQKLGLGLLVVPTVVGGFLRLFEVSLSQGPVIALVTAAVVGITMLTGNETP